MSVATHYSQDELPEEASAPALTTESTELGLSPRPTIEADLPLLPPYKFTADSSKNLLEIPDSDAISELSSPVKSLGSEAPSRARSPLSPRRVQDAQVCTVAGTSIQYTTGKENVDPNHTQTLESMYAAKFTEYYDENNGSQPGVAAGLSDDEDRMGIKSKDDCKPLEPMVVMEDDPMSEDPLHLQCSTGHTQPTRGSSITDVSTSGTEVSSQKAEKRAGNYMATRRTSRQQPGASLLREKASVEQSNDSGTLMVDASICDAIDYPQPTISCSLAQDNNIQKGGTATDSSAAENIRIGSRSSDDHTIAETVKVTLPGSDVPDINNTNVEKSHKASMVPIPSRRSEIMDSDDDAEALARKVDNNPADTLAPLKVKNNSSLVVHGKTTEQIKMLSDRADTVVPQPTTPSKPENCVLATSSESCTLVEVSPDALRILPKVHQKQSASFDTSLARPEGSQNKDTVLAELKSMKISSIQAKITSLQTEISRKRGELEMVTDELTQPAEETVKKHIDLLHKYNDIRDIGQGLVGMVADNRGVRVGDLYDDFGVGLKD